MKISIISPAYNEENIIQDFIKAILSSLDTSIQLTNSQRSQDPFECEVIVVDDGSTDNTRNKVSSIGDRRVKVVGYADNRGKGYAIRYGFKHSEGDIIIMLDSDMNISPHQIMNYINMLENGDIVIASKYHPRSRVKAPLIRKILSKIFHTLVKLLIGIKVSDTQSGLKAFRRSVLETIMPRLIMKLFLFDVEVLLLAERNNFKIVEYPISIDLGNSVKPFSLLKMVRSMLQEPLALTYRLRILRYYDSELDK